MSESKCKCKPLYTCDLCRDIEFATKKSLTAKKKKISQEAPPKREQGAVELLPTDDEIKQVACDESCQDWDNLSYAEIYEEAFIDGAKWMRDISRAKPVKTKPEKSKDDRWNKPTTVR